MAVGDDAQAGGYPIVPHTGTGGEFKEGFLEINRTRDFIAQVKAMIDAVWPISKGGTGANTVAGARTNLGISGAVTIGTAVPSDADGNDGDVYFKYTP